MSKEFWQEFEQLLDKRPPTKLEYRMHYNEQGDIYACTMQDHPDNTKYIVVTRYEYDNYTKYRVTDGKLERIPNDTTLHYRRLKRSDQGFRTVKGHAGVLLETEDYPEVEYYEHRNS
jgi:hypothetical protein